MYVCGSLCLFVREYVCACKNVCMHMCVYQLVHVCWGWVCLTLNVCVCVSVYECVCVCVLAVYNKAQAQRISIREFKLWTFLQGIESRVATFLAETCVMQC